LDKPSRYPRNSSRPAILINRLRIPACNEKIEPKERAAKKRIVQRTGFG
jgi:hypothetical protein